ncbi:hypothetical protein F2Q69_00058990 [Brassica cretica]|uniref:Uncharacterized protein n=1 Tax=Brassica cretica TaxID=69181 RepID=A0A8S9RKU0_BRACR|nr:hypothetical protein F2Q69_00058990 [Brassica cretica]
MIWMRYMGDSIEEQTIMHGFGSYPLIDVRDNSVATDRPRGLFGRYIATDSFAGRLLRRDQPNGLVGRYIVTDSFAGRLLRSDRPSGLDGRCVATDRVDWTVAA